MKEWIPVSESLPSGKCLVFLENEMRGRKIHSATYHPNLTEIGGNFEFDSPKVTHWMPLPTPPAQEKQPNELD